MRRTRRIARPYRIRGVGDLQIFIAALFVSAAGLNALANWVKVPYPITLVLGGLVLGLIPGIPTVTLNPDLVLLVFLPPLLYSASFFADLRTLRNDARVITINAIGLTVFTAGAVGVIAHQMIHLPWAMSFALGAIVSPTDPAAATAIMRRVGAPRRMVNVLEGESLVNDAAALVMYKVAVAAAIGESVSTGHTILTFFGDVAGGLAIGLVVGWVIAEVRKRVSDVNTELTISLFSAYGAFIPADQLGVSGVLAVVACGLVLGFRAPEIASPESRMQGFAMWSILTFLINATLFILIGLQLPTIVDGLAGRSIGQVLGYAAIVCGAVIALRFFYNFVMTVLIRTIDRRPSQRARRASWRLRVVGGWSGMRGAVSLAAALALPLHTNAGDPLPGRDLIQFITFSLIVVTVVGEGLTLPWLIRRLGVVDDGTEEENEETKARLVIARAALDRVDELEGEDWTREQTIDRVRRLYQFRQRRFKIRAGKIEDEDGLEESSLAYQRLMHEIYAVQRQELVRLRNTREISAEVMRRVERELDLEEQRLEV
ncbi:MAG: monovalent cation/hydrogen antiporter [Solirubrobacterales bacterium]|nr:monovalent cation/hydrogen antiporter [Solirubrobacterales bacterium]